MDSDSLNQTHADHNVPASLSPTTAAFAELAKITLADTSLNEVMDRIAEVTRDVVPGADEASVTLVTGEMTSTAAATGELALNLDEAQYEQGYGPCLDAARGMTTLVIRDMSTESRWPKYAPIAVSLGAGSSISIGLPIQAAVVGGLNIYSKQPLALGEESIELAEEFASYAAVALANAQAYSSAAQLAKQMQEAMASRAVIEQAKGVIMTNQRCTPDQAFMILSKASQNSNRKLRELAAEIVAQAQN